MTEFKTIDLEDHLKHLEVISENFEDVDGSTLTLQHKKRELDNGLSIYLYDSGQVTLAYRGDEIETAYWNEETAEIFSEIENMTASELFEIMNRNRIEFNLRK